MSKISILVPICNVERYLRQCLDSLVAQTLEDIEIICINDGSKDSSLDIIQEYAAKDNRIKIINKENSGYGDSMNKGLELASGEYIGILESDDFTLPEMYDEMYSVAQKNNADMVISDFYKYWSNKPLKKVNSTSKYPLNRVTNIKETPFLLRNKTTIWSAIYKKDFINKNNIRFLTTPGASYQDTSFRIKTISLAERIVCLEKAYVRYRQDNASSSVKSKGKVFIICQEYEELTNFMNSNPEIKKYANSEKLINQWAGYVWNLRRVDKEFLKEFTDRFYQEFKGFYDAGELDDYFYQKVPRKDVQLLLNDRYIFMKVFSAKHKKDRFLILLKNKLKNLFLKKEAING